MCIVLKLGGSLLSEPGLGGRLADRLDCLQSQRPLLVVGGGAAADLVRVWDQRHRLGNDATHWLAVRAMTFNSHLVAALLPRAQVVETLPACAAAWRSGQLPILDVHAFLQQTERPGSAMLPYSWAVTSDTIAARVARRAGAAELLLLKSVSWPMERSLEQAARAGVVDECLPYEVAQQPGLRVHIENFRQDAVAFGVARSP